jgi:hypothetical protein
VESIPFAATTAVVLDVPDPVANIVMSIRRKHRDELGCAVPVEITVAGSSGVGEVEAGQDPTHVFAVLDAIAADTAPICARFVAVMRFPTTDIFVLTLADERPFRALHERVATSGIRFQPSPFPYTPHCTLRSRSPVSATEAAELLSLRITDAFILTILSVYMLDRLSCTLLHRVSLTGHASALGLPMADSDAR